MKLAYRLFTLCNTKVLGKTLSMKLDFKVFNPYNLYIYLLHSLHPRIHSYLTHKYFHNTLYLITYFVS